MTPKVLSIGRFLVPRIATRLFLEEKDRYA